MTFVTAADRIIAVKYPIFYRNNCSQKVGARVFICVMLVSTLIALPRVYWTAYDVEIDGCRATFVGLDQIMPVLGVVSVLAVSVATIRLLVNMNNQGTQGQQNNTARNEVQREVSLNIFHSEVHLQACFCKHFQDYLFISRIRKNCRSKVAI